MISKQTSENKHVLVIVLGDIGRSPRMQYHALSLLEHGHWVSLIGYEGEDLIPQLNGGEHSIKEVHEGKLNVVRFSSYSPPLFMRRAALPIYLILRSFGLVYSLCSTLALINKRCKPALTSSNSSKSWRVRNFQQVECILVQNPPSIPLLLISYIYTILQAPFSQQSRPGLVIDWHNLGYTMFQKLSPRHPIKLFAEIYEKIMAPRARGNLCVTNAMQEYLITNFNIERELISPLYDRPPEFFHPTNVESMHDLMIRLQGEFVSQCPELMKKMCGTTSKDVNEKNQTCTNTLFTKVKTIDGVERICTRSDRPALVISSTSWTPDEDFSILLEALITFDASIQNGTFTSNNNGGRKCWGKSHVVVVVTGKGPQKEMYEKKMKEMKLKYVTVMTLWLESSDYPLLLGCADLGVSLHTSTSGLDLPMKILDMFGCEVPACAIGFDCLDELVQDGVNGCIFNTSDELARQMFKLLNVDRCSHDDHRIQGELSLYRNNIKGMARWRENWKVQAHDIIMSACSNTASSGNDTAKKID